MGPSQNEMQKDLLNPCSMELFQEYETCVMSTVIQKRWIKKKDLSGDIHYNPSSQDPEAERSRIQLGYIDILSGGRGFFGLVLSRA